MAITLDLTPPNQISPRWTIEVRTDTLRHALADLRRAPLPQYIDARGLQIDLADGSYLSICNATASDGQSVLLGVHEAVRYSRNRGDEIETRYKL
jgi:hypothetical protein